MWVKCDRTGFDEFCSRDCPEGGLTQPPMALAVDRGDYAGAWISPVESSRR